MNSQHTPRPGAAEIIAYVALAIALCFIVASPGILGVLDEELSATLVPLAQLTPLIATIPFIALLRRRSTPQDAPVKVADLLALRWRGSMPWTCLGVGAVAAIAATQLVAGLAVGWQFNPPELISIAIFAVAPFLLLQSVFAFGEETGWRGWLVTRTQHLGFPAMAAISAVAWTLFHIPAVLLFHFETPQMIAYLASIASWAPFLVALRLASGSVWPVVFAHGAINSVRVFFLQSVATADGPTMVGGVDWAVEALGIALWVGAGWWLYSWTRSPVVVGT